VILDTEYLGNLVEQNPAARQLSRDIRSERRPGRVPSVVYWELFYGLGRLVDNESKQQRLRTAYEKLMRSRAVLDLDESVARRAGTLRGRHEASDSRRTLDGADSVVAAHGLILNEPVVSNDSDFQAVDGLDVVTY
jgi:predicted nucleic acid-binding protein